MENRYILHDIRRTDVCGLLRKRLAKGDIQRIGAFILAFGLYALVGSFFLAWYEGSWGPDYYLSTYGEGFLGDFHAMINICRWCGLGGLILGIILFITGIRTDRRPS